MADISQSRAAKAPDHRPRRPCAAVHGAMHGLRAGAEGGGLPREVQAALREGEVFSRHCGPHGTVGVGAASPGVASPAVAALGHQVAAKQGLGVAEQSGEFGEACGQSLALAQVVDLVRPFRRDVGHGHCPATYHTCSVLPLLVVCTISSPRDPPTRYEALVAQEERVVAPQRLVEHKDQLGAGLGAEDLDGVAL